MKLLKISLLAFSSVIATSAFARPVIMLTGYWPPTNEMLREFSPSAAQNRGAWNGENWEGLGFDVKAYFPEYKEGDEKGTGDFEVDFDDTRADLARITEELQPVALVSFGKGSGPWEIEQNFPDFWDHGPTLHSSLPVDDIATAVNAVGSIRAWVDYTGDPGDFLCGFLSHLGAQYKLDHAEDTQRGFMQAQGFIHVGEGYSAEQYRKAVHATLRALIKKLHP